MNTAPNNPTLRSTFLAIIAFASMAGVVSAADPTTAVAVLHATPGNNVTGVIRFAPAADGKIRITGKIEGLGANAVHAFHIHEFGDCCAPDATSAGGHYNPEGHEHGLPEQAKRHAGDMGNLKADDKGVATVDVTVDNITISAGKNPIIGRSIIVHVKADDGGQPTGNAGARIACGVIGWASPAK